MSHNTSIELEIKDVNLLKKALVDALGLAEDEVEVHKTPVEIQDYYKQKTRPAHVVVRAKALRRALGQGFADAGFFVEKGSAVLNHDDMDTKLAGLYGRIKGQYARHTALEAARKSGRRVEERVENGKLVIKVTR